LKSDSQQEKKINTLMELLEVRPVLSGQQESIPTQRKSLKNLKQPRLKTTTLQGALCVLWNWIQEIQPKN